MRTGYGNANGKPALVVLALPGVERVQESRTVLCPPRRVKGVVARPGMRRPARRVARRPRTTYALQQRARPASYRKEPFVRWSGEDETAGLCCSHRLRGRARPVRAAHGRRAVRRVRQRPDPETRAPQAAPRGEEEEYAEDEPDARAGWRPHPRRAEPDGDRPRRHPAFRAPARPERGRPHPNPLRSLARRQGPRGAEEEETTAIVKQ